ncbi:MAG: hypothetical protein IPJ02_10530 [Chitinophagaceae bacterium]|nr:hypothetical protein [Chitinophagaceae bacterium]
MRKTLFFFFILVGLKAVSQVDSTSTILMNELDKKVIVPEVKKSSPVFYAQRLINANTVEVLPTGRLNLKWCIYLGMWPGTLAESKMPLDWIIPLI